MAAFVEKSLCRGCGTCVRVCPVGGITLDKRAATVNSEECTECGVAVQACPFGAVTLEERILVQNLPSQTERTPRNKFKMQVERRRLYDPEEILKEVQDKLERSKEGGESIDYLTFVPDGEPTLDVHLGREIELLKPLGIKIAVITNASLIGREDVRQELMKPDWVSLKVDSVREEIWRRINRGHHALHLSSIQDGMLEFAEVYNGELATETMLVKGVNDSDALVGEVADFSPRLRPAHAYLSIPTRPPAEEWVQPPSEESINRAYQILSSRVGHVEYLIGYEGNAFAFTGNVEEDLLSIAAVHPMREEAVSEFLARAGANWSIVHGLITQGHLIETEYEGRKFYMRRLYSKKA